MKKLLAVAATVLLLVGTEHSAGAQSLVIDKKFSNCAELNKVYPGGVSKSSKVVNHGGATKHKPTVNAKVYNDNASKDRDKDGIACEK